MNENAIFIGFLIVIVILVVYFAFFYKRDDKRRNSYKSKQQKSGGTADNDAVGALEEIKQIKTPTAEDNYNAGRIEELNVLEGNINNARNDQEIVFDIIDRYMDTIDAFRAGGGGAAIIRARLDPEVHLQEGINDVHFADVAPEVMVANIGNFALGGLDFILGEINEGNDFWAPVVPQFRGMIVGAGAANTNLRENRINAAAARTENKSEFANTYLSTTVTHTSDPQNVHDSSVNEDLKNTLTELRSTSSKNDVGTVLAQIESHINKSAADGEITNNTATKALEALRIARLGSPITQYGEKENIILKLVWDRTNISANKSNSSNMKNSVINALADCITDTGGSVCAGGRASRYLESLVLQDFNPKVGAAQRQEEYKNQILSEVAKIIDNEAELAADSKDEEMKKAGQSYKDPNIDVDETVAEELRNIMKNKISAHIDTYREHFKQHQLDELKKDCLAAVL